jgi:hypothetical protein
MVKRYFSHCHGGWRGKYNRSNIGSLKKPGDKNEID